MLQRYITQANLPHDLVAASLRFFEHVDAIVARCQSVTISDDDALFTYHIPKLGEGGACSLFGELEAQKYDLRAVLGEADDPMRQKIAKLQAIVDYVIESTGVEWFGIYQNLPLKDGSHALVKLAYSGEPSRAEFPMTEAFKGMSNNVTVGFSGEGRVLNDIPAYLEQGGEYYTCDPKVKSEVCLPVFDKDDDKVLGIIDAEAFQTEAFDDEKLVILIASTIVAERYFFD